jgi:F-type H+-transporting ATPase subunit b
MAEHGKTYCAKAEPAEVTGTEVKKETSGGLPQMCVDSFVPQLSWLALSFLLLYVVMARVILPRIGGVLEERRDKIADDLDKAQSLKKGADDALKAYEAALAQARGRAQAIAKETGDKLRAETDRLKAEVEAKLSRDATAAESRIHETKNAALANLNQLATDVAGVVVSHLLGTQADSAALARAVEAERAERKS